MHSWPLQDAKNKLSQLVRDAQQAPQRITLHGREAAIVLSPERYAALTQPKESLLEFFQNSPWAGVELELPSRDEHTEVLDL